MISHTAPHKAVILARDLGSRMRRAAEDVALTAEQSRAVDAGVKAMISLGGRSFLDFVISVLADAGFTEVYLVIGPEHDPIRDHYDDITKQRMRISYVVRAKPLGTANVVLATEEFAGGDRVLVLNPDNYYPTEVLELLHKAPGSALVGFTREGMLKHSNIPAERIVASALVTADAEGNLAELAEEPDEAAMKRLGDGAVISMNCWLCTSTIFAAARVIPRSAHGEYEIADVVRRAITDGDPYRLVRADLEVLNMSSRGDIASVVETLHAREVLL